MTYLVIRLLEPERKGAKPIKEFISLHKTYIDACVEKYGYALDGHRMETYEFNPEKNTLNRFSYEDDPTFFATVKSVFLTRQKKQKWEAQKELAIRPEDV